jgi:hypothetical protein
MTMLLGLALYAAALAGGDTVWATDIWIINGQEVWVEKEYTRGEGQSGYTWTGNWRMSGRNFEENRPTPPPA